MRRGFLKTIEPGARVLSTISHDQPLAFYGPTESILSRRPVIRGRRVAQSFNVITNMLLSMYDCVRMCVAAR